MTCHDAIINPVKRKNSPALGPVAVLVSGESDLFLLCRLLNLKEDNYLNLFMSRLYAGNGEITDFSVAGPLVGAPYAALILETIIAWGAKKIIFFGLCGSISDNVKIGDIIVPACSIIDEGTSCHYNGQWPNRVEDKSSMAHSSGYIVKKTKDALIKKKQPFHEGIIWSTDAIYRETRGKIEYFQDKGALAVEMETSALFTIGKFRNVEVGAILVVSDELSTFKWKPGFREERFKKSCEVAGEVISSLKNL